jgi:1,6-anhydro-N-acetylmuramate kinase
MKALFEQSGIKIEKEQEFAALKQSIERLLGSALIEKFFKQLEKKSIRIREFEKVLEQRVIDGLDADLAKAGKTAKQLYEALAVTDQGQMREFYLTRIEEVSPELRQKFHKLYSYY